MGLLKKLKKLKSKSLGAKLAGKSKLLRKSKLLQATGMVAGNKKGKGGSIKEALTGGGGGDGAVSNNGLAPVGSRVRKLQDRGAKIGYAGPASPATPMAKPKMPGRTMTTGGGGQVSSTGMKPKPMRVGNAPAPSDGTTMRKGPTAAGVRLNRIAKGYNFR